MWFQMTSRSTKWCPNGCGKSAIFLYSRKNKGVYYCDRCKTEFNKKQLDEYFGK